VPGKGTAQPLTDRAAYCSDCTLHQALRLAFQVEPYILMLLGPGERCDPLHEIKDAFRLAIFFAKNRFDDHRRLGFGKAALAQEGFAVVVGARNDPFPPSLAQAESTL
jgi:hypothetical protein